MPAPDLKPQVPGEPLTDTSADPQAAKRAELEAIAALNAPEVIDGLATMTSDELHLLHAIETDGKGRVTVLGAINAALAPPKSTDTPSRADISLPPVVAGVVAGALYDFLGFLTTRDKVIALGATEEAGAAVEAVSEWAEARSLSLDDAQVADWQERGAELTAQQDAGQAAGDVSASGDPGPAAIGPRRAVLTEQGWVVPEAPKKA